jgi:multiple sugar transport system permease protein
MTRTERENLFKGLSFISPWLLGFTLLTCYPVLAALYFSFCDYDVLSGSVWIGAYNYRYMMGDDVFWKSLWNTLRYAAMSLPLGMITALFVAILLNQKVVARSALRTIYFLPSLIPVVAATMIWLWIFNGEYSLLNYMLSFIGIEGPQWLTDPNWTLRSLVLMSLWGIGGQVVIYLAALQDVPRHLYESAEIDGAGWWRRLWHVTVPMISPVIYFNMIIGIIGSLQVLVQPLIMFPTGGPDRTVSMFTPYIYDQAFQGFNMGYACAMAVVMFLIIISLTWLATSATRKHVFYGGA